jgi:HD-like signal output (HDOD) protein/ActR/RegA family two-component response regulator
MKTILVANASKAERQFIARLLKSEYSVEAIGSAEEGPPEFGRYDLVLIDSNFTPQSGLDFLMDVYAKHAVPVLMLFKPEESVAAVEALRLGMFNYLVKTAKVYDILHLAIQDALKKCGQLAALKDANSALKERIDSLETTLSLVRRSGSLLPSKSVTPAPQNGAPAVKGQRHTLLTAIVEHLNKGEVNLPVYPKINHDLRKLIKGQPSVAQVASLLGEDVTISAKLIGVVNSPYYRTGSPISDLDQAISRLGFGMVMNYVEMISNRAIYTIRKPQFQPMLGKLWEHAKACAHASRMIATRSGAGNPDEVFSMGLLHDIGKLFLLQVISELETSGACEEVKADGDLTGFLGMYHERFGEKLLHVWKLPAAFCEIALHHGALDNAPRRSGELLAVHLANRLVNTLGYGENASGKTRADVMDAARLLDLDEATIDAIGVNLKEQMEGVAVLV